MQRIRYAVLPEHPEHRKAHALRPPAFLLYIVFLIVLNLSFQVLIRVKPGVLGFSSAITSDEVIEMVNKERRSQGLSSLRVNEALTAAAIAKGRDMFAENYWSHVSPSGVDPWYWIKTSGYDYRFAGENLAKDFTDAASVVRAWMNSPSHRDNLLSDRFEEIGVAVMDGTLNGYQTTLVVEMFGAPKATATLAEAQTPSSPSPLPEPVQVAGESVVIGQETEALYSPPPNPGQLESPARPSRLSRVNPLVDSFGMVRSASISLIFLLLGIVGLDVILVTRRRIVRIGSHSFAHAIMLGVLLVAVWYTQVGVIL